VERSRRLSSSRFLLKTLEWASLKWIKGSSLSSLVLSTKHNPRIQAELVLVSWFLTNWSTNLEVNLISIQKKELVPHFLLQSNLKAQKIWKRNLNQLQENGMLIVIIWRLIGIHSKRITTKLNILTSCNRRNWFTRIHSNLSPTALKSKMKTPSSAWIQTLFNPKLIKPTMKHVKSHWSQTQLQSTMNNESWSLMINSSTSRPSSSFLSMVLASMLRTFATSASMASKL